MMVVKRLRWEGFLVFDENILKHIQERNEKVTEWILDGSLKAKFHFTEGIDNAAEGFVEMLQGKNVGKAILKIADPEEK
jgi:NADPH-dependent curcumin reductase CurA